MISKKSHSAVGAISAVSVCAMAVATAAIICVLSVFNGFRAEIGKRLDTLAPDVKVTPARGKVFADASGTAARAAKVEGVEMATITLQDNALVICGTREMPVTLKGVIPEEYARVTSVKEKIEPEGRWLGAASGETEAVAAIGTASQTGALPGMKMLLFAPRRQGRVNLANPASSFKTDSVSVTGIYRTDQQEYDENSVLTDIETARRLLQYTDEASAIEIKGAPGTDSAELAERVASALGSGFVVKGRLEQQQMNFRMVSIEKWVSFLLLFFILVIASFNLLSSLSMLVLEKEDSLGTLSSLGMSRRRIGAVFAWESIYVSLVGGVSGLILGILLCLGQMRYGWINLHVTAEGPIPYPVHLEWGDLLATLAPVLIIGLVTAFATARFAIRRASER